MSTTQTTPAYRRYQGNPAEIYERYFVPAIGLPAAAPAVEAAGPRHAERVLDVACGTGVAARLAAQRVGAEGLVAGIDSNPLMLQVAASSTPAGTTIHWQEANADGLPFPDATFDVAICSLGLQFFARKTAALAEMRRVLTAQGRMAIAVPGPTPPLFEHLHDVLAQHLGAQVAAFVRAVFAVHEPARLASMMAAARLEDIDVSCRPLPLRLPAPADFLWQYILGTPLSMGVAGLDAGERAALESDMVRRWQPFADDTGMDCQVGLTLATAARGAS